MHWKFQNHCKNSGETRALHAPFTRALPSNTTLHSGNVHHIISRIQARAMASPPLMSLAIVQTWFDFFFFLFVWWNKGWVFGYLGFFLFLFSRGMGLWKLLSYEKSQASDWKVLTFELSRCAHLSSFSCALPSSVGAWMPQARSFFIQLFLSPVKISY